MIRVTDLEAGARFYERSGGLRRLWSDASSIGLAMSETDAEIVVHTMDLPPGRSVHYLVDDVPTAVTEFVAAGCAILEAPFEIPIGRCAVLTDPFGNALCILDMSKGERAGNI